MKEISTALEGKTLYIAGGTGFVGKALIHFLNSLSWHKAPTVIVSSRGIKAISFEGPLRVLHHQADLKTADLSGYHIDYFIHAATSTDDEGNDIHYLASVTEGTKSILDQCAKMKVSGFLYISSGAVYGINTREKARITEDFPTVGDSAYGKSKIAGEKRCREFFQSTSIPTTIARCFTFSGPDIDINRPYALTSFLRQALRNEKITILGTGLATRSYMDQRDLAKWLLLLLLKNKSFECINVGSPEPVSILELAHKISSLFNAPAPEIRRNVSERENYYVPSVDIATEKYGLSLDISLEESLARMIDRYRKTTIPSKPT